MSANAFTKNLPEMIKSFTCPLTLSIMRDPVIGSDGHSYIKDIHGSHDIE